MKQKLAVLDKIVWGVLFGAIGPFIGIILAWLVKGGIYDFKTFWKLAQGSQYMMEVLTWCLIPNMFFFWLFFFYLKHDNASRGLVMITLLEVAIAAIYTLT